eukprot:GHRQ01007086.1.p1 GENE.GHRQ01007086.1~~GHRQ01007086.1.p1  ORF type:complete len:427 (+),score=116.81 GHRQ01007086.1:83-1363(+)
MSSSTDRRREPQKFANSNLNGIFAGKPAGQASSGVNRFGMLTMALPKRTKSTTTTAGAKLVVPKPVNLPSIKKEHQGNDPSTQLVPSGTAGTGWSKPEEPQPAPQPQPEVRQSALTAGSNWASQDRQDGSSSYVPPVREGPYAPGSRGSFPVERHLNPEEYPSLAAGAKEKPPVRRQYEYTSAHHQQDLRWGDDERDVGHSRNWPGRDDGYDDDRYGSHNRYGGPGAGPYRGPSDYDEPRPGAGRYSGPPGAEDEFDFRGGRGGGGEREWAGPSSAGWREREAHYHREGGRGGGFERSSSYHAEHSGSYDRYGGVPDGAAAAGRYAGERSGSQGYDSYADRDLLPPPPPPRGGLGPAGGAPEAAAGSVGAAAVEARAADSDEERDLEREEFEAELARVAAELERVSSASHTGWVAVVCLQLGNWCL